MIRLEMKNVDAMLIKKQQKQQHCHQVKLINMNILEVENYIIFHSKANNRTS